MVGRKEMKARGMGFNPSLSPSMGSPPAWELHFPHLHSGAEDTKFPGSVELVGGKRAEGLWALEVST